MFSIQNLSIAYRNQKVIDNFNFQIDVRGKFAFVGRNGSGKSTLAYYLAGVIPGFVSAEVSSPLPGNFPSASLIMQNPSNQFFGITVEDELSQDAIARFSLSHLAERKVFELSEGQKQKVNLAANLSQNPALLLMDEPLELLDPRERNKFLNFLNSIKECGLIWFDKDERFTKGFKTRRLSTKPNRERVSNLSTPGNNQILEANLNIKQGSVDSKFDISLREGEKVAIIGCNGSGKTTLLNTLASLLKHNGKINSASNFSLAFQNPVLGFNENTVEGEILNPPYADLLGVSQFDSEYPFHLSKGQQKLVSLCSLVPGTIHLLDEPTTWLDEQNRSSVLKMIAASKEAMLIATHDEDVANICDRVVLLNGGVEECSSTKAKRFFQGRLNTLS